jgi:antirestriction protein ArdC
MMSNQEVYANVTQRIIDALDKGIVPWHKPWSGGGTNAPRNAFTNRPYRGMNVWLLSLECALRGFDDPRWATFNQVRKAGGKVMKGAKSVEVLLWKPTVKPKTDGNGDVVMVKGKPVMSTFLFLRTFRVFNVAEMEGVKLREPKTKDVVELTPIEEAEKIVQGYTDRGPGVKYGFDHACYIPSLDVIELPAREQFDGMPEAYATTFHEFTHSTGHKSRCDREGIGQFDHFGSDRYAKEELVAEMGSSILCAVAGIEATFDNSVAYIQSWKGKLQEDPKLMIGAAAQAQRAVDYVLGTEAQKEEEE